MRNDEMTYKERLAQLNDKVKTLSSQLREIEESISELSKDNAKLEDLPNFRKPKVIDMSCLVGSGIDCEFSMDPAGGWSLDRLIDVVVDQHPYVTQDYRWNYCRPRLGNITFCQSMPNLPDGLDVDYYVVDLSDACVRTVSADLALKKGYVLVGFRIVGLLDGYEWEWEQLCQK